MKHKIQEPCYFYNTGGCFRPNGAPKTAAECKYLHIKTGGPIEKPQHLRAPCKFYHLRKRCGDKACSFGHSDLPRHRWYKFFPGHQYPGNNYGKVQNYQWRGEGVCSPDPNHKNKAVAGIKAAILMLMLQLLDEIRE